MKICDFCKKEYERESQVIHMVGSTFCSHDEKLEKFKERNYPFEAMPLDVWLAKEGRDSAEQKYIDNARRSGDSVVRGSDGLLRRVGED